MNGVTETIMLDLERNETPEAVRGKSNYDKCFWRATPDDDEHYVYTIAL